MLGVVNVGSGTAGVWILGMLIYFFFLIVIVTNVSNFDATITYSGEEILNSSFLETRCETPRYTINDDGEQVVSGWKNNPSCELTFGQYNEDLCNALEGCTWENVTSGWWLWESSDYVCNGDVNTTYYNNNETHSGTVCSMSSLQNNEDLCFIMGCTYYTEEVASALEGLSDINTMFDTIAGLIVFDADIGVPTGFAYLFSFIFFYIPLLVLIMAILMYIRG